MSYFNNHSHDIYQYRHKTTYHINNSQRSIKHEHGQQQPRDNLGGSQPEITQMAYQSAIFEWVDEVTFGASDRSSQKPSHTSPPVSPSCGFSSRTSRRRRRSSRLRPRSSSLPSAVPWPDLWLSSGSSMLSSCWSGRTRIKKRKRCSSGLSLETAVAMAMVVPRERSSRNKTWTCYGKTF